MSSMADGRSVGQLLGVALVTVISTSSLLLLGAWVWQSHGGEIQRSLEAFRSAAVGSFKQVLPTTPPESEAVRQGMRAAAVEVPSLVPSLVPGAFRA
jgi:hypothetical protein